MSQSPIAKVTACVKTELPALHKEAEELHGFAEAVKGRATQIMGFVRGEFTDLDKELAELQAALGMTTNGAPADEAEASGDAGAVAASEASPPDPTPPAEPGSA